MRRARFLAPLFLLVLAGALFPFGQTHAATDCYQEYLSQKKFTSEDCVKGTQDLGSCKAASAALLACSGPEGALAAAASGDSNALLMNLGNLLSAGFPSLGGKTPTCDELIPFYKFVIGECQRSIPELACGQYGKGPGGCCITRRESTETVGGTCTSETEQCVDKDPIYYSCCYCRQAGESETISHMAANSGQTYESCSEICKTPPLSGAIDHSLGAGTLERQALAPSPSKIQSLAMYCFKPTECSSSDYQGTFQSGGEGCKEGEGRCIAPEPEITLSYPIGSVTTVKGYRNFISTIFSYLLAIVAIAAAVMFIWAGFRYIFGSAFQNIQRAKEIMVDAAVGLVLVFAAIAILRTINPNTLNLNRLNVFMINKSRVLNERICNGMTSDKPLELAKAGSRPNLIPFSQLKDADYSVKKEEAACGEDYYVKGFGDFTCAGRACPKKQICHKCFKPEDCPEGTKKGASICEEGQIGGNIDYTDCRYVNTIHLLAFCSGLLYGEPYKDGAQGPTNSDASFAGAQNVIFDVANRDWTSSEKNFNKTSDHSGGQRYNFSLSREEIQKIVDQCHSLGSSGIAGFVLGVRYQDPGLTDLITCRSLAADDYAIVGKNNCNGGGVLDGYFEGEGDAVSLPSMQKALWCGLYVADSPNWINTRGLVNTKNWWGLADIYDAIDGTASIQCDFSLAKENALINPISSAGADVQGYNTKIKFKDITCLSYKR